MSCLCHSCVLGGTWGAVGALGALQSIDVTPGTLHLCEEVASNESEEEEKEAMPPLAQHFPVLVPSAV